MLDLLIIIQIMMDHFTTKMTIDLHITKTAMETIVTPDRDQVIMEMEVEVIIRILIIDLIIS